MITYEEEQENTSSAIFSIITIFADTNASVLYLDFSADFNCNYINIMDPGPYTALQQHPTIDHDFQSKIK